MADDVAATYGPEPMATLTATPDGLALNGTRGNFRLPRSDIAKVGRGTLYPWIFGAVRIHHTIPGYPANLQFKPLHLKPRELLAQLKALGYAIG